NAGDVKIGYIDPDASMSPEFVSIGGNVLLRGGDNLGSGSGGSGGKLSLTTTTSCLSCGIGSGGDSVGPAIIGGFVDARGGSAASGTNGGTGGHISVNTGTLQVLGSDAGVSIDASGGTGGSSGTNGADGTVDIFTDGFQPVPFNFDLMST